MGVTAAISVTVAAGAYTAYQQNQAGKAAGKIGEFNAGVAGAQADDALVRGRRDERDFRAQTKATIGSQRASLAAQGVEIDEGSALAIQEDTARQGELDAITIRNNAAREAWGFRVGAVDAGNRARIDRAEGRNRATATVLNTGASAMGMGYSGYGGRSTPKAKES